MRPANAQRHDETIWQAVPAPDVVEDGRVGHRPELRRGGLERDNELARVGAVDRAQISRRRLRDDDDAGRPAGSQPHHRAVVVANPAAGLVARLEVEDEIVHRGDDRARREQRHREVGHETDVGSSAQQRQGERWLLVGRVDADRQRAGDHVRQGEDRRERQTGAWTAGVVDRDERVVLARGAPSCRAGGRRTGRRRGSGRR